MPYTNLDLVRAHLGGSFPGRDRVLDRPVSLVANDYVTFHDIAVDESAVVVKSDLNAHLTHTAVTLNAGKVQVGAAPLVPGSIVIASDSSLGRVYSENADYIVDYSSGEVRTLAGGAIGQSQSVIIWYDTFTVYSPGVDYALDAQRAALKRLSLGAIGDGQRVLVDFTPLDRQVGESLIIAAVTEANAMVEREIDPDGEFGADATLQAAATHRALETICRASAMQELRRHFADDKIASTWMKLAEKMAERSADLIRAFRKPFTGPITAARS